MCKKSLSLISKTTRKFTNIVFGFLVCSGQVLSHSFELKSKTKGLFYGSPAVVTLRVPSKGVIQVFFIFFVLLVFVVMILHNKTKRIMLCL